MGLLTALRKGGGAAPHRSSSRPTIAAATDSPCPVRCGFTVMRAIFTPVYPVSKPTGSDGCLRGAVLSVARSLESGAAVVVGSAT